MTENRIAKVKIANSFLRMLLHFPFDVEIIRVNMDCEKYGNIDITITSPEFPELNPGDPIPIIRPKYRYHYGDNGEIIRVERTDWGM